MANIGEPIRIHEIEPTVIPIEPATPETPIEVPTEEGVPYERA